MRSADGPVTCIFQLGIHSFEQDVETWEKLLIEHK